MELRNELIRPSRNKHRSNAVAAMRLLDRRETVTQLEHELTVSRTRLEQEEIASSESWKKLGEKKEQLKRDELNHIQEFHFSEKLREEALSILLRDEEECRQLNEQQHFQLLKMECLEKDLTDLTSRLEFLQNYQNTLSDVEGFDRVVGKFQELNLSVQNMSNEYSVILQDATGTGCNHFHPTEFGMRKMMLTNKGDVRNILGSNEASVKNKLARNSQWHVISISESFKQHGHMYLAILNLAAHLSSHPIARTLMNIGKKQVNTRKTVKSRSNQHKATTTKRDEPERVASVEQMQQPIHNYKERWKMLAAAAMGDGGFKTRSQCVADASFSSEYGRVTDSVSVEIQQKLSHFTGADVDSNRVLGAVCNSKQSTLNKIAATKLNFIEQILYDLTLIKDEIEFATDPVHYNDPGHSFA